MKPPPAPTITLPKPLTNHWLDPKWEYKPSTSHNDASEFRKRMEMRRKEVQQPQVPTTERKS